MTDDTRVLEPRDCASLLTLKAELEAGCRLIGRILAQPEPPPTVGGLLDWLVNPQNPLPPLSQDDAYQMLEVVEENRRRESWPLHALS